MSGSWVQNQQNSVASPVGTIVCPYMTVAAGNSLAVFVQCSAASSPTISDSNGNIYTLAASASAYSSALQLYYAQSIAGGATQVSATGGVFNGIFAAEISGISTLIGGTGQNQNGPGSSADNISSGYITVLNLPAYLIGMSFNSTGSGNSDGAPSHGTGFIGVNPVWGNIGGSGQTVATAEHMEIMGYGSIAATFTTSYGSDLFITVGAAFFESSSQTNTATVAWLK